MVLWMRYHNCILIACLCLITILTHSLRSCFLPHLNDVSRHKIMYKYLLYALLCSAYFSGDFFSEFFTLFSTNFFCSTMFLLLLVIFLNIRKKTCRCAKIETIQIKTFNIPNGDNWIDSAWHCCDWNLILAGVTKIQLRNGLSSISSLFYKLRVRFLYAAAIAI